MKTKLSFHLIILMIFSIISIQENYCQLANSAWPMYKHDLQHSGRSQFCIDQDQTLLWNIQVKGVPGSPVIGVDSTIYLPTGLLNTDTVGFLYAINPNGTIKWRFQFEGLPSSTTPAIAADGTIFVHMNGNEGNIAAIEKLYAINQDGTLKWLYELNGGLASFCCDIQSSPAIGNDGTIYIGCMNTALYAINPDGSYKWSSFTGSSISSSPAIGTDGTIYVSNATFELYAYNPDGTLKWQTDFFSTGGGGENTPSIGNDGTIYLADYWGHSLLAINSDGSLRWRNYKLLDYPLSTPSFTSDEDIVVCANGLYAFQSDGVYKWKVGDPLFTSSSPVIGSNGIIYWRESWAVNATNGDGIKVWDIGTGALPGGFDAIPAIGADGTLYISLPNIFSDNQYFASYISTPRIISFYNASRCQPGSLTLEANVNVGIINWYSSETGGTPIGTGTYFNTPILDFTTTFYVDVTYRGITSPTRTAVTATITAIPTITSTTDGSRCGTGAVTLGATASEGSVNWYSASTDGSSLGTGTSFTTPSLTTSTIYYVDATNNGCTTATRTAVTANITCTEINSISFSDLIKLYPNPTTGIIEISTDESINSNLRVELYNNLGSLIKEFAMFKNGKVTQLDLSGCSSGLYLLRFDTGKDILQYKIIKD